jgi:hypothetical protein
VAQIFTVTAARSGRFWFIEIPALGVCTQARSVPEIRVMAQDCIAMMLDVPLHRIRIGAVQLTSVREDAH